MFGTASSVIGELCPRRDGEVEQPQIDDHHFISVGGEGGEGGVAAGVVRYNPMYHSHTSNTTAQSFCKPRDGALTKKSASFCEKGFFPDFLYHSSGRLKGGKKQPNENAACSNGEAAKAAERQKSVASDIMTHHHNNCDQKRTSNNGVNGKHFFSGTKEFAVRTTGGLKPHGPSLVITGGLKNDRSRRNSVSAPSRHISHTRTNSLGASPASVFPAATGNNNNNKASRGKGNNVAARSRGKKNIVHEVSSRRGAVRRTQSVGLLSASKRVVHQTDSIQRDKVRRASSEHVERKIFFRVMNANDLFWKREREKRQLFFNGDDRVTRKVDIPQVVAQPYDLPAVLESAIAEHHLALLMKCPRSEIERVVAMLTSSDFFDVMRFLRHLHGKQSSTGILSAASQVHRAQGFQKEELLVARQRHLQGNGSSFFTGRNGLSVDAKGGAGHIPKNLRHFMRAFTREACMAFLDECCAACCNRLLAEHLLDGRGDRESSFSDMKVMSLCGRVVTELLFHMLKWTNEESSRVLLPVLQFVMRHLSSHFPAQLDSQY